MKASVDMAQPLKKPETAAPVDADHDGLLKRLRQWLRANLRGRTEGSLKEALEEVLEEHEHEAHHIPTEEQNMLKNVLSFGDLSAGDIMTPRTGIKAVEYNVTLEDLKAHIAQHRHTRIPVYNDTLDTIKGFVHLKDLVPHLYSGGPFNMALILRDILVVPPSMKLANLLLKMRLSGVHMAFVVDEYGGTEGLLTLEDLFERIVGEIQDEHDEDEQENTLLWSPGGTCDVDARVRIEKLEADLGLALESKEDEADYDTLGGLIFYEIGHVPVKGEIVRHAGGAQFLILSADLRSIHRVRIYRPSTPPAGAA